MRDIREKQIKKLVDYVSKNDDIFKLVIFGNCITDKDDDDTYLEVAIEVSEENIYNDEMLYNFMNTISDITDGKFEYVVMNDPNLNSNTINLINNGVIAYGY